MRCSAKLLSLHGFGSRRGGRETYSAMTDVWSSYSGTGWTGSGASRWLQRANKGVTKDMQGEKVARRSTAGHYWGQAKVVARRRTARGDS